MVNKAKLLELLDLADKLAHSNQYDNAKAAVVNNKKKDFEDACVKAKVVTDDLAGRKTADELFIVCRKLYKDADWGWD